ncbi:hypothetical protein PVAP13_9NG085000 [Panicum virgatum]|uniref:DUF7595 domain-containing protein n=1 Tax=Panicum virgatum TaxID=38727 RepID=A0A8T0MD87_PANVG|nr:hypothetical protein PVAP13_9NG085000 [Panicum virgatum]
MEAPPPTEPLPIDLQLEIVAHSDDAATIVRCAAASKPLRGAVYGPGFRPRTRAALRAAVNAGFDPALLLGVPDEPSHPSSGADQPPRRRLRFDTDLLRSSFEPPELRVCNASTGGVTSLPCMDVEGKWGSGGIYRPALLNLGRGGRSFELLVMDVCLRTRIFSSGTGSWGPICVVKPPPEHGSWCVIDEAMPTFPAVVRRTVHWICRSARGAGMFVLALRVGAAQATAIAPPPPAGRLGGTASCTLTDAAGTLRMVVSEAEAVSMWRMSAEGWSQEAVISKQWITKQVAAGMDASRTACWCVGFRERSGAVTFRACPLQPGYNGGRRAPC